MSWNHREPPLCQVVLPDGISWPWFLWHNIQSGWPHAHMAQAPHICPRSAFWKTQPHMQTWCFHLKNQNTLRTWSCKNTHTCTCDTFTYHFVQFFFFFFFIHTLGHCVYTYTLTNRKWCQSLSPGRQRRLLRYRDSGFLFLSFFPQPLCFSHGLSQIDTSPSVAGVHPSHPLITGRPSESGLASLYLPLLCSFALSIYQPPSHYRAISARLSS